MKKNDIVLKPVAYVANDRKEIKDDNWGEVHSTIQLAEGMAEEMLDGIDAFSHLEVIFYFDKVPQEKIVLKSAHPRGNPDYPKVGILAQRKKSRPNLLGLTVVEFVERKGDCLVVKGLDAIDGTPILDIKPVMREFLPQSEVRQPEWATDLMRNYW